MTDPVSNHPGATVADPPRAFAQGTGVLLQAVGAALVFTSCCACSTSFLWDPPWTRPQAEFAIQQSRGQLPRTVDNPAKLGLMLIVFASVAGGLALMVFGLGLQSEKRRSGMAAMLTNLLLLVVLAGAGVGLWTGSGSIAARVWHAVFFLAMLLLLVFTVPAWRQMCAHPPPDDLYVVPADFDPRQERHDQTRI